MTTTHQRRSTRGRFAVGAILAGTIAAGTLGSVMQRTLCLIGRHHMKGQAQTAGIRRLAQPLPHGIG
jgi:hypothetical protein